MRSLNSNPYSDSGTKSISVLHIDDEKSFLDLTKIQLKKIDSSIEIDIITNPLSVFQILEGYEYNVIVCDFQMPNFNGLELFEKLRKSGNNTPFIILTGKSTEEIVIQALNSGVDYYLQKSSKSKALFSELYHLILSCTDKKREREKREITAYKRVEETLREKEEKYSSLIENLPLGIYRNSVDAKGQILQANPAMVEILGYESAEELMKVPAIDFYVNPDERKPFLRELLDQGHVYSKELRLKKKDGTPFWGSITARLEYTKEGEITWMDGILEDITDYKLTETALRESEERYRVIIEDQIDMVSRMMPNKTISFVNEAYCRFFNKPQEELIGKSIISEVFDEDQKKLIEFLDSLDSETPVSSIEHRVIDGKGETRWIQWTDRAILNDEKNVIEIQSVGRDITEKKRTEQQLRESEEEIRKQKEEIELYLSILTHDLNNYHTTTREFLEFALNETNPKEERIFLEQSRAALTRSTTLINNISVMMKQRIPTTYSLQPIKLLEAINKCIKALEEFFPEREIVLIINDIEPQITILADSLFEQLLLNLFTNAVKNDVVEAVEVEITSKIEKDDNICILSITDHGRGIPPEQREGIFERFTEFRKKGKGSGLGLFIVKTLVDRYQGKIWIEDRIPGDHSQGTSFIIELQLA
ncbi:MAG: PAS domain S-box protein [Candidatus Hodarchaeales archaeon]|jgi:PAS domain S-box-containing protein